MDLNEQISICLEVSTIATLIAGLYCMYSGTDSMAIPTSVYIEIAEKLIPYLEKWDYSKLSFEEWIKSSLLIIPKVMVEENIEEFKKNDWYWERDNGNIVLVITAEMV